jgi:putative tryptophan/tyrosine transport system substrate-binding protein
MRRRDFITFVSGAAVAWSLAAHAQQPTMPVIGYLNSQSPDNQADYLRAFRQGLKESGYVEGENVLVHYSWAENQSERLPALAADLVRRRVAVIAAFGGPASESAAKATATIPIVFMVAEDPVRMGLITSLARPAGNLTGVNFFSAELAAKRLELLRELVPRRYARGRAPQSGRSDDCRVQFARRRNGGTHHGDIYPGLQCQHQRRTRCCLSNDCARPAGRSLHQ